jgi:hypothetical protein
VVFCGFVAGAQTDGSVAGEDSVAVAAANLVLSAMFGTVN